MKWRSRFTRLLCVSLLFAFGPIGHAANPAVGSLDTCFSPVERCDLKLIALLQTATKSLDIAIYSITHPQIVAAIIAAKTRGVKVRMVVDRQQSTGTSSLVTLLKSSGISLRVGNVQGIMHDKFSIVDKRTLETGSFNYTNNASESNAENQIYLNDPSTILKFEVIFAALWSSSAAN